MDIFTLSASFKADTAELESGLQKAQAGFSGIISAANSADGAVSSFASDSAEAVSFLGESFETAWADVRSSWSGANSYFSGIASSIKSTFSTLAASMSEIGQNMWDGLREGMDEGKIVEAGRISVSNKADADVSSVDFASSSLGKSSSAQINTMISGMQERGGSYNINLVVDGRTLANVVFDPLNAVSKQKGVAIGA